MSTTITVTRGELLTRVGLPVAKGGSRFGALRAGGLRTTSGVMSSTYSPHDRPGPMTDRHRRSPSLEELLRFAAATEKTAAARGRLASRTGRPGPQTVTVTETSRRLLTVFEQGIGSDVLPYWKMAALIRPLARIAGPGAESGLALDLPARLLEQEFGHGRVARFEDVDFPAQLTHQPTRRFLSGTGLPVDGCHLQLDTEIPLPTLAEYCADESDEGTAARLPQGAGDLIRLGGPAGGNSLVVDGGTGTVLTWNEPEATLRRLNTDVSTLAFTLWLLHRAKTIDFEAEAGRVL